MTQNINQFAMTPVQGQMDIMPPGGVIGVQIDSTSGGGLVAGQAVSLVDTAGELPLVKETADDTSQIFGFIVFNAKQATYAAGDRCQVAAMRNCVQYMTASAAIARGAQVMIVQASQKIATATSGKRIAGYLLDKAAADGDLVRVIIDLPGTTA